MSEHIKLKIGDTLYKYSLGFFEYTVFEIRQTENSILYAVRCKNCKDHENCELLIAPVERTKDELRYVEMLNDEEEEQYFWHITTEEDSNYFTNKNNAMISKYKQTILKNTNRIEKLEQEKKELNDKNIDLTNIIKQMEDKQNA